MTHRAAWPARAVVSAALVGVSFVASTFVGVESAAGQGRSSAPAAWTPPRTPDGHPDLQGIWDFRTATPLERPRDFAGKEFFTPEEAAQWEDRNAERIAGIIAVHPPSWLDYGMKLLPDLRTSLIVDPPGGHVPALTPDGQKRATARAQKARRVPEGPEDLTVQERCLVFSAGPPIVPGPYNNNLQIVQTPAAVVVMTEMIHDARIVPLDGRPHLAPAVRRWLGDSRGSWKGDTLVVETTNFTSQTPFRGSDENLTVTERYTRTGPDTLSYEFTIDDPTAFASPWTVAFPMARSSEQMYEYACHEGNYGLLDTLKGARYEEQKK